ncbi:MAG: hypothetical protein ABL921_21095, partial [Pirellula sp.]
MTTPKRNWPIATFAVMLLILNGVAIPFIQQSFGWQLLCFSFFAGQIVVGSVIGGLYGRSWLVGLLVGTVLAAIVMFAVVFGQVGRHSIFVWNFYQYELARVLAIPALALCACSSLLAMRVIFGWRLTQDPHTSTRRGAIGPAELLVLSAAIASILMLCQSLIIIWETPSSRLALPFFAQCVGLAIMSLCLTLPATFVLFRVRRLAMRWFLYFALGSIFVFVPALLGGQFHFGRIFYDIGQLMFVSALIFPGTIVAAVGLECIRLSGYRLASYETKGVPHDEQSRLERRSDRRMHTVLGLGMFAFAALVGFAAVQIDYQRNGAQEENYALLERLRESGGSIDVYRGQVYRLSLANAATNQDIVDHSNLRDLTDLSLRGTQVTDAGLKGLRNFPKLKSLDLSDTQITNHGMSEIHQMPALQHVSFSGTTLSLEAIKTLLNAKSRSLHSIDLSRMGINDENALSLRDVLQSTWSISFCGNTGLTDKGLSEMLPFDSQYIEMVDLSGTSGNGSGF